MLNMPTFNFSDVCAKCWYIESLNIPKHSRSQETTDNFTKYRLKTWRRKEKCINGTQDKPKKINENQEKPRKLRKKTKKEKEKKEKK